MLKKLNKHILLILAIGAIILPFFLPQKLLHSKHNLCFFYLIFHKPCPLCGITRSFISITHLKIKNAFNFNPTGILWFCFLIGYIIVKLCEIFKIIKSNKISNKVLYYIVISLTNITILYWIITII